MPSHARVNGVPFLPKFPPQQAMEELRQSLLAGLQRCTTSNEAMEIRRYAHDNCIELGQRIQ